MLRPPFPFAAKQAGLFQHIQMLRESLARERKPVPIDHPHVKFEERLSTPLVEFIYETPTRGIGQGFEDGVKLHQGKMHPDDF